jgi:hypothetical protein
VRLESFGMDIAAMIDAEKLDCSARAERRLQSRAERLR